MGGTVESSVIFSIGTALGRAKDQQLPVAVLVAGDWLRGQVVAVDGHGLLLETERYEHCMVRIEAVSAVRIENVAYVQSA